MTTLTGQYKLAEDGETPVECFDIHEWGRWFEDANRVTAKDQVGEVRISTVFLGIDHSFAASQGVSGDNTDRRPVLWETMIFGGPHDGWCERYSSHSAAVMGHEQAVMMVKGSGKFGVGKL